MGEVVKCRHQGVPLFPAVALCYTMRGACFVNPNIRAGRAIELTDKREERAQLRAGKEGAEHGLARRMVKCTHCVHGEDNDFQVAVPFSMLKRPQCAVNCSTLVYKVLDLRPPH